MKTLSLKELLPFKGFWHSIKQEHIESIFSNNLLEARTTQRYWNNGMVYRDDAKGVYENSHYMKGWSISRDKMYAIMWNSVTLLLDSDAIKRDFKIKPISWNYRSQHCKVNFNKEREEFIISNFMNQTFDEIKEEYFEITDQIYDDKGDEALQEWRKENGSDFIEYWQRKGKRTIDFNKYLLGVFVCKESYDIYKGRGFNLAVNHPLFKGFVNRKEAKEMHSKSMTDN
jgi:hypothetical protein